MSIDSGTGSFSTDVDLSMKESLRILELSIALRDNDERMDELLADFAQGFAKGWRMAVGTCFRDALDVRLTDKIVEGTKTKTREWTQGGTFSFSGGDTLYDTSRAYERWETALQSIGTAYQVLGGTPSRPEKQLVSIKRNASFSRSFRGNVERRTEVFRAIPTNWTEREEIYSAVKQATGKGVSPKLLQDLCDLGALERRIETVESRFPGTVRFHVLAPNADRSKLCVTEERSTSQDDFVALLIAGDSPCNETGR